MDAQNKNSHDGLLRDDVIDLRQYWLTVMRHKWGILGFAFVVTLLSVLVVFSLEPVYRATATLLIESKQAKVVSIEEVYGLDSSNNEYYLTQFEILKSRKLAEKVIRKYDLVNHPEFKREPAFKFDWREVAGEYIPELAPKVPTEEQVFQSKVDAFIERLTISPVRKTQLVKISFDAFDPQFSAQMANAVGEAYIESNLEAKLELTVKASSWLNERLGGLKDKLKESERRLQAFRDREQIVGERGGLDIASTELDLVATKLVDARRQRLEIESLYQEIQALGKNAKAERYERIPAVLGHPVVQNYKQALLEVEQKKSELAKRYGPKHPKMISVNSEIDSARRSLDRQIMSVVNGIENQYRVARKSERSLEGSLGNTKQEIQGLKRKQYQLKELEQEVETNRQLYDTFFTRLNETAATGDLESANARLADPAVAPNAPAKPKKGLIIALSFVVSMMFGVMCAFLLEALNNTIRSSGDVQEKLGQTMLGLLPKLPGKAQKRSYRHYIEDGKSGFSEAVRTIRTGLVLSSLDNPHKVIAVTSTVPGEGKTSTSLSLAYSLGQMERVLLIDADMRRPSIGKLFKFGSKAPGLSNLVAGTASLEECVHRLDEEGIDVISAGVIPPNPLELLSSERFGKVLEVLERQYDRIVIDTAPCQAVSDSLVLAPRVGSMVYVIKADSTPSAQIKAGLRRLSEVNAPLVGVVLNQVNLKKASRYYGEGYSGYYDVYGYGADEKAA
ncbi:polysaccharide biosynthesis tyrosine autokinase [Pontibacterium granulatum]|uniref:GumC family protein n=1 Tax=Pontibacterium granulatum TaxID=2036029 RepID=UPI002499D392|nr:polysaccharide biosynthesis tyrosine autokinase [Pontibacterium granulatum]MDI3325976.1 polysaccharide biosynthesis tyrosine autokinase [Pontibacterium granulatum]